MKIVYYLLIIGLFVGLMNAIGYVKTSSNPPTLTHEALQPDYYLRNAKIYFQEGEIARSKGQLGEGIKAVEKIREAADEESNELIAPALHDIRAVYEKLPYEITTAEEITIPCVEVLLALTYQQIIVAENLILEGELSNVNKAIDYAMEHVKTALVMSQGDRKESEVMIYAEMNDILSNPSMPADEMMIKIQKVKEDTRDLEVSFFH